MVDQVETFSILPVDIHPAPKGQEQTASGPASSAPADSGRNVALQFVTAILADREGGFELQLSPEELGRVKLSLQVADGAVTLAIQAERPETLELMRRNIDVLEREFREAGFTSLSFTFGHGSADGRPPRTAAYADAVREPPGTAMPAVDSPDGFGNLQSTLRLDLRL